MSGWLTYFQGVTVVAFIAIAAFTLGCVALFMTVVRRAVQAGVKGALDPLTHALAEHEGRIKGQADTLDRFGQRLADVETSARKAHIRLDDLGAPRARTAP